MNAPLRRRRAFTMITILWMLSVGSVVAAAGALSGRRAVDGGRNRVELERASWRALGCARHAQATIDGALREAAGADTGARVWRTLDRVVRGSSVVGECSVALEAAGTRLDINSASTEMIERLAEALGLEHDAVDLASALVDWRDTDRVALPRGAEDEWYRAQHRIGPRNGPLADPRELRFVRGFESPGTFEPFISTEPGRVSLATAPVPVLMAVPGITRETAEWIVEARDAGDPISSLMAIVGRVSDSAASALAARFADAARLTTPDPDAWLLRATASGPAGANVVVLQWRLVRAGRHADVAETRSLP